MVVIACLLFAILFFMKRDDCAGNDYLSMSKTFSVRGIMAVAICFSHVLSKTNGFYIHRFLFPATVSIFFFYSGYGLMHQMLLGSKENGKNHYFDHFFVKRLSRIVISSILIRFVILVFDWKTLPNYELGTIVDVLWTGMWFTKVIIIFYIGFWLFFRKKCNSYKVPLLSFLLLILVFIVVCRCMGLPSYWYGNSFAFLLGLIWAAYRGNIDKMLECAKNYVYTFGIVVLCLCGSSTIIILVEQNIISIHGPGMLAAFLIGITYPILWNLIMMRLDFRNSLWEKVGKISFEMYIAEGIGRRILLNMALDSGKNENLYALVLLVFEMLSAYLVAKLSIYATKKIRKRIVSNS